MESDRKDMWDEIRPKNRHVGQNQTKKPLHSKENH